MAELSQELEQPLSTLVHESQQLADTLRESRIVDRLQALRGHAAASAELVQRLTRLARPAGTSHIINRLLDEVLQSASTAAGSSGFTSDFTSTLPDYTGDRETTARFFRQLLAYAGAYLATVGRPHLLAIKTGDLADTPTLFPVAPSTHIHLDITETEIVNPSGRILPSLTDTLDVLSLYRLAGALGATLDVSAPASGPFRMIVRLPTGSRFCIPSATGHRRGCHRANGRRAVIRGPLGGPGPGHCRSHRAPQQRTAPDGAAGKDHPRIVRLGRNGHEPLCEWSRDTSEGRLSAAPIPGSGHPGHDCRRHIGD